MRMSSDASFGPVALTTRVTYIIYPGSLVLPSQWATMEDKEQMRYEGTWWDWSPGFHLCFSFPDGMLEVSIFFFGGGGQGRRGGGKNF